MNYLQLEKKDNTFEIGINDFKKTATTLKEVAEIIDREINDHYDYEYINVIAPDNDVQTFKLQKLLEETNNYPVIITQKHHELTNATIQERKDHTIWNLDYHEYQPGLTEYSEESLTTIGNGFFGVRGTTPEMTTSEDFCTGIYLAGVYNQTDSKVDGQTISNEDLVNLPNGQFLTLKVDDEVLTFSDGQVSDFHRYLNFHDNQVHFSYLFTTKTGKKIQLEVTKQASFYNLHTLVIKYQATPLNFSGDITFITAIDGDVRNYNVKRYRNLNQRHLVIKDQKAEDNYLYQYSQTTTSHINILEASKLTGPFQTDALETTTSNTSISQEITLAAQENTPLKLEKTVEFYRFFAFDQQEAEQKWHSTWKFEDIGSETKLNEQLWEQVGIELTGDLYDQKLINLHTFHLLVSANQNSTPKLDVSVTSRGLHGEAYRGHIFWDELFIAPFYLAHNPQVVKAMLLYRYRRLQAAKDLASENNYQGAMYPWQSGLKGDEQSQKIHLNPLTNKWDLDNSRLQNHVSLAIAYNIISYLNTTNDQEFLNNYGLEMLLEIGKFWLSKLEYDAPTDRFHIDKVMGPDEFHEAYPHSQEPGLKDNAYTNILVSWLFNELEKIKASSSEILLRNLTTKVGFSEMDWQLLNRAKDRLSLEINQNDIVAQYQGFFDLQPLDFAAYREKYGNIDRMDRILKSEGKEINDYQAIKQPDFLMLYYLFDVATVNRLIENLGYQIPQDFFEKNLAYYESITTHGSTLSRVIHSELALANHEPDKALAFYQTALESDYHDIQGGTTAEGIHTGVMASTYWLMIHAFGGVHLDNQQLAIQPQLPAKWQALKFNFTHYQINYQLEIRHNLVKISADKPTTVRVGDNLVNITVEPVEIPYNL